MKTYVLYDGPFTAAADFGPITLNDAESTYIQVVAEAGVTGVLSVQTSADNISWVSNATTLAINGTAAIAGLYVLGSQYFRASCTHTGAAGALRIVVNLRGVQSNL